MAGCYFLVAEQESNQRNRLKEALSVALPRAKDTLLKNPPVAHLVSAFEGLLSPKGKAFCGFCKNGAKKRGICLGIGGIIC